MPKHIYSDFDKELAIDSKGQVEINYDEDVIVESIRMIIAVVAGERVRSPFGGSLVRYLFEPISPDVAEIIGYELREQIERFEPRVTIDVINVYPDIDNNRYEVSVRVTIKSLRTTTTFQTRLRSLAAE